MRDGGFWMIVFGWGWISTLGGLRCQVYLLSSCVQDLSKSYTVLSCQLISNLVLRLLMFLPCKYFYWGIYRLSYTCGFFTPVNQTGFFFISYLGWGCSLDLYICIGNCISWYPSCILSSLIFFMSSITFPIPYKQILPNSDISYHCLEWCVCLVPV